jgi:hypothetical protein
VRALFHPPGRRARYVPNHVSRPKPRRPALVAVLPQLTLLIASALLPFYAIAAGTAEPRLILSNAFISAVAIWSLLPAVIAAVSKKIWNEEQAPYAAYQ